MTDGEPELKQTAKKPRMRLIRLGLLFAAVAGAHALAGAAHAQAIICCNQSFQVEGGWIGSNRVENCQGYFDSAPTDILRALCKHRALLTCINTYRCATLPPEPPADQDAASDPDRDGLEQGFYGPPPPEPSPAPAVPPPMPRRLVYIAAWGQNGDTPSKTFSVWLDRAACPLPLDQNNRLADSAAARHVVRGKVIRRGGRVQIEAEARERPGGAKLGPFSGEAEGEDAAAVAKATRAVTEKLKLVCAR